MGFEQTLIATIALPALQRACEMAGWFNSPNRRADFLDCRHGQVLRARLAACIAFTLFIGTPGFSSSFVGCRYGCSNPVSFAKHNCNATPPEMARQVPFFPCFAACFFLQSRCPSFHPNSELQRSFPPRSGQQCACSQETAWPSRRSRRPATSGSAVLALCGLPTRRPLRAGAFFEASISRPARTIRAPTSIPGLGCRSTTPQLRKLNWSAR